MRNHWYALFFLMIGLVAVSKVYTLGGPNSSPLLIQLPREISMATASLALPLTEPSVKAYPNPLLGEKFYIEPDTPPARQAAQWREARPNDAKEMELLAAIPRAIWFGAWNVRIEDDVRNKVDEITRTGSLAVLVAYNVPSFDCDAYEKEQDTIEQRYLAWMQEFANGIGNRKVVVILEPDALAGRECLNIPSDRNLIKQSVTILKANPQTVVYIDAGHAVWNTAKTISTKLLWAGIANADGFSLNVSNFITTEELIDYGTKVSNFVGGKHFIIDTSRNGRGPTSEYEWCNPSGRAVGIFPTATTGNPLVDAYLWIKQPGESDGMCNGGPAAGVWWPEYALELMRNRSK